MEKTDENMRQSPFQLILATKFLKEDSTREEGFLVPRRATLSS
jgi:hypothetical protein